jgi:2-oxoisovalerate dehydrogenase E1 component alpha subunit
LYNYLVAKGWWTETEDKEFISAVREDVLGALKRAEGEKKPAIEELFTDVYDKVPQHLQLQQRELLEHISKYPDHYPTDQHATN